MYRQERHNIKNASFPPILHGFPFFSVFFARDLIFTKTDQGQRYSLERMGFSRQANKTMQEDLKAAT
jgi:hypothetical protein